MRFQFTDNWQKTSTTAFLTGNRNDRWPHMINYQDNYAVNNFTQSALTAPRDAGYVNAQKTSDGVDFV